MDLFYPIKGYSGLCPSYGIASVDFVDDVFCSLGVSVLKEESVKLNCLFGIIF